MILIMAARKQANPETEAPMKSPQIIPTAKEYLTTSASALHENKPDTNSGEIKAMNAANIPPRIAETNDPIIMIRKNPIADFIAFSVFIFFLMPTLT